jgi:hypothetical protein
MTCIPAHCVVSRLCPDATQQELAFPIAGSGIRFRSALSQFGDRYSAANLAAILPGLVTVHFASCSSVMSART